MAGNWGNAAQGALGGATAGASIGGPWGAAIGGILGGGLGLLGPGNENAPGAEQNRLLMALAEEAAGRGSPTPAAYSDFRTDQRQHLNRLQALASGQGPSLASEMLKKATSDAQAGQAAMAAGARGNPALAARQAMNNTAGITTGANQAAAMARAQEQLGAIQQLGLGIYGARGQDESTNQFNSNLALQALANNDRTRLMALQGSVDAAQKAAQAPTWGDYLMGFGGGVGQIMALANASKGGAQHQQQTAQNTGYAPVV